MTNNRWTSCLLRRATLITRKVNAMTAPAHELLSAPLATFASLCGLFVALHLVHPQAARPRRLKGGWRIRRRKERAVTAMHVLKDLVLHAGRTGRETQN